MKNLPEGSRPLIILFVLGILVLLSSSGVWAESLWTDQSSSLYSLKLHNFQIGDLITIEVVEQATASQQAGTNVSENGTVLAGPGTGLLQKVLPMMGGKWDSDSKGKGSTTRQGTLKATITVTIKDINPNGALNFEGRQVIKVNKADQILTISGTVRPEDIGNDNVARSCYIANSVIDYQGGGTTDESQDTGVLTKFFHWLF